MNFVFSSRELDKILELLDISPKRCDNIRYYLSLKPDRRKERPSFMWGKNNMYFKQAGQFGGATQS